MNRGQLIFPRGDVIGTKCRKLAPGKISYVPTVPGSQSPESLDGPTTNGAGVSNPDCQVTSGTPVEIHLGKGKLSCYVRGVQF